MLGRWLEKLEKSNERHLLILENIDKIESGSITVLNNYFQDLKKGNIFINNKEYKTPPQGMILLVAREEIKWSPA